MYANENKGKFPPDLDTIVKTQDVDKDAVRSPFGPAKEGKDFVLLNYDGKVKMNAPNLDGIVIAYDQAALEQGEGTNALYADGHVQWHPAEGFKKVLEDSRKRVALLNAAP